MKASETNRFMIVRLQHDLKAISNDLHALAKEFHEFQHEVDLHFLNLPEEKRRVIVKEVEIELPDHLRLTYSTLKHLKRGTAQDVACITKRARANESMHLCYFERMGLVKSERSNRQKIFIFPEIKH